MTDAGVNPAAANAIAGLLLLARAFPRRLIAQRAHRWEQLRRELAPPDLEGQTVLIVGVGALGAPVARFAQALAMRVIGVRRSGLPAGAAVDEMHAPAQLDALLPRAQWVVLACPYSTETHHLLDARRLGLLARGAGVINVAHSGLIDPAALATALAGGHVGSAYLDVFESDPPPALSPLRGLPNVLFGTSPT